jgi:hypothetical protein
MDTAYAKWPLNKAFQNVPKLGGLVWENTIWQPCSTYFYIGRLSRHHRRDPERHRPRSCQHQPDALSLLPQRQQQQRNEERQGPMLRF